MSDGDIRVTSRARSNGVDVEQFALALLDLAELIAEDDHELDGADAVDRDEVGIAIFAPVVEANKPSKDSAA